MKKKVALIFGITGQDGSYLTELLLRKKYFVHGVIRRSSNFNTQRIDKIFNDQKYKKIFKLHYGDILDQSVISKLINKIKPDEIYNLAAQSHVAVSFDLPIYTAEVDAIGCLKILEAIRNSHIPKKIKYYQAGSSEMFGSSPPMQSENTRFQPNSIYASSKLFAHDAVRIYRNAYKIYAVNGILFNHESSRRGNTFVTKKIINGLIKYKRTREPLELGNIYSKRDWGHASDYVEAMWLMLQQKKPDDFIISTGKQFTVKDFINIAAKKMNINILWKGMGFKEKGIDLRNKKTVIKINKKYFRPLEVDSLCGDFSKAKKLLKWRPKISLDFLVDEMIKNNNA